MLQPERGVKCALSGMLQPARASRHGRRQHILYLAFPPRMTSHLGAQMNSRTNRIVGEQSTCSQKDSQELCYVRLQHVDACCRTSTRSPAFKKSFEGSLRILQLLNTPADLLHIFAFFCGIPSMQGTSPDLGKNLAACSDTLNHCEA